MKVLWIILTVLAVLLFLVIAFLAYGKATIRLIIKNKLRLVLRIGPVPIMLISDKEKKAPELTRCYNPRRVLKKEIRLQEKRRKDAEKKNRADARKAEKKARKKALAQKRPKPNVVEYGDMAFTLLQELFEKTSGRIDFHIQRLHIYLATGDAASTALLYVGGMQVLVYLLRFIETKFNRVKRPPDAAKVIADFASEKSHIDIDISAKMHISEAITVALGMLKAYRREKKFALSRAEFRALEKQYAEDGKALDPKDL